MHSLKVGFHLCECNKTFDFFTLKGGYSSHSPSLWCPTTYLIISNFKRSYFVKYFFNVFFSCMVGSKFQKFPKNPKMNINSWKCGSGVSACSFKVIKFLPDSNQSAEKVLLRDKNIANHRNSESFFFSKFSSCLTKYTI